jgi:predicted phosphodiesterase
MRYLILSDIHANREALSAVLAHVRRKRWDRAVFLGDLVGYGANPNQTVEMLRRLKPLVAIRGNHDKVC